MAALLQSSHAFSRAADRLVLGTEILAVKNAVAPLHRWRIERAPAAARGRPAAVRAAKRVDALLAAGAAQTFVGHVLHAVRTARDQHVAHDAVLADAQRRAIDEETKAVGIDDAELEQVRRRRIGRRRQLLFGGLGFAVPRVPGALPPRPA